MNAFLKWLVVAGICALSAILLTVLARVLEKGNHPLLGSLVCVETEDPRDLYWNINQIEVTGHIKPDEHAVGITLQNNIPNFRNYLFRINNSEHWQETGQGSMALDIGEGTHTINVRAANTLGRELPPVSYTLRVEDSVMRIAPAEKKIVRGKYDFRFEKAESAQVSWLRTHTLPVVAGCSNQWDIFITLRRWVRGQIPNRMPVIDSQWDAKRILESVWGDPSLGFICDAYAATYVSACVSVGLNARMIHLGDSDGRGHYATEIWSDDYAKWVFMDPLYDCHFSLQGQPLAALELHQLWKSMRLDAVVQQGNGGRHFKGTRQSKDYYNLFRDIQLVNANDFLTTPLTSAWDLLTSRIRFIRFVDDANPPLSRGRLAYQLVVFYYLPRAIDGLLVPVMIPVLLIIASIGIIRKNG